MKVQSIYTGKPLFTQSAQNNGNKNNIAQNQAPQSLMTNPNSVLVDKNYNQAFINKSKNVSFGKDLPAVINRNPIEASLNTALGFSGTNDIVLVGKNLEKAREDLLSSVNTLPKVVSRVLFIEDKKAQGSFFVGSDYYNQLYLQNLSNTPIFQNYNNEEFVMRKNNYMFPRDNGNFKVGKTGLPFNIKPNIEASLSDLKNSNVQIFDFKTMATKEIADANKIRINSLGKEEEKQEDVNVRKKLTFKDVGGQDKAIKELKESVVYPIKYPEAFKVMNHGVILNGGPGTGKTLIAEALANEVDANFIKLNGLEMKSKWVGVSEENWRKLFDEAKSKQPCIVFIDEFDAVAMEREGSSSSRYDDQIVNQLLTIMSDLEKDGDQVFVIAATNKSDLLDKAVTRSGRFGKHIEVPNPSLDGCEMIFNIHTRNKKIDKNFNSKDFVERMHKANVSGADIAAIAENAKNQAYLREGIFDKMENGTFNIIDIEHLSIKQEDFDIALENFKNENKKNKEERKPIGFIWQ